MSERAAVILAAGQGTRMRSPLPKVLHPLAGRTLLDRAIDAAQGLGCQKIVVVAPRHAPEVEAHALRRLGPGSVAIQDPPRGTGHAVLAAEAALTGFSGRLIVTYADTPLLEAETAASLFKNDVEDALAVLGFEARDPGPYGRLVLDADGGLQRIVEAKDASPLELEITLCNSGVLAAPAAQLFTLLRAVTCENAKQEYYLTDVVALARAAGGTVVVKTAREEALMGVNSQEELARAEAAFQEGRRQALLDAGVTMPAPATVFLAWDTQIEPGVRIEPNVVFGPGVVVKQGAVIRSFCHIEGGVIEAGAIVGPFARLRPGASIGAEAHIGNFVEVKNVRVEAGAKANHLAYLGDGVVGAGANIGAGVIFCNYDGFDKHRTIVGPGAFVGSNSALVAPISVGAGAYVGSGSVVTQDVAENALALERSPQVEKPGWAERFRARRAKRP